MASTALHRVLRIAVAAAVLGTAPAEADILVGVAAPLTGPYEWGGAEAELGVELLWSRAVVAGTTDGKAVADALRRGKFQHDGLPVWFDTKGDAQGPSVEIGLWVWHDGKPVVMAPPAPGS